ncbi:STAS domain-containing protein [uncultured Fibrobacter sp.]|uniref:STAS domain-containing protein n=1 Tax=uncultured Fibrobacter sp. TaxID=261512 RepID=UPI0026043693|nr:STAS domain-containing protein [uncultured Fibrobacter sp.]
MAQLKNYREVGIFDLISAPLNPIGAFDAEQFKKDVRALLDEKSDERFLAVDLMGLDFVYSDAYNAFIQFQQEMVNRGGLFAVLTNNKVIVDGLKKAGLDKSIKVFAFEADMMSFSLHAQAPAKAESEEPSEVVAPVTSQNKRDEEAPIQRLDRRTGQHRRFTKSFNAVSKDKTLTKKGLDVPFDDEPSSARTVIIVILLLLAAIGGILAFFYI